MRGKLMNTIKKSISILRRTSLASLKRILWLKRAIRTSLRKALGASDYKKWSNEQNLKPDWDSRTEQMAKLIRGGTSVIEFGAGRLVLKPLLPENCSYAPSDLVDRGKGTIVVDLNSNPLPRFPQYDVAVFSGVLEYINDVPRLISHLSNYVATILASYAVTDANNKNRRAQGWVNDYSAEEIINIFKNAGFQCTHMEPYKSQIIYKFIRQ